MEETAEATRTVNNEENQVALVVILTRPRIELGKLVATPGALFTINWGNIEPAHLLYRHSMGDWGDVDQHDWKANDKAAAKGGRIVSSYTMPNGTDKVWIITEADRSVTTILRPDEY